MKFFINIYCLATYVTKNSEIYILPFLSIYLYVIGKDGNSSSLFTLYRYTHKFQRQIVAVKWQASRDENFNYISIIKLERQRNDIATKMCKGGGEARGGIQFVIKRSADKIFAYKKVACFSVKSRCNT